MHFRTVPWIIALLAIGGNIFAAEPTTQTTPPQETKGEETTATEPEKPLTLAVSLTVPTAYMFRGYVVDDSDIQLQPDVRLDSTVHAGSLTLHPHLEFWSNVIPDSDALGTYNELDVYGGCSIDLPAKLLLDFTYNYYNSPADDFDDVHEIGVILSHDDFLQPHVGVYREVKNSSNNPTGKQGTYLEVGINPELPWKPLEKLTLTAPCNLGMGGDSYYFKSNGSNQFFGFASFGIHASYQITDNLSFEAGGTYYQLLSDSTEASNAGHDYKFVGDLGLAYSF